MRAGQCADVYRLAGHSVRYTSWLGQARKKKRGASNNHAVTHRKEKTAPARQQRPPRGVIAREIINGDEMIRVKPVACAKRKSQRQSHPSGLQVHVILLCDAKSFRVTSALD